jgi:Family of unknown function (DUF6353)
MLTGVLQQVHKAKFLLENHSTTILTGLSVAGTTATAVLTARATFKAADLIQHEQNASNAAWREGESDTPPHELSKTEKAKLVWRLYLPPAAVCITTVTSTIVANKISSKKIAALAVAGGISERALQEYKDKVVEKLGKRENQKIRDEIAQDRVTNNPVSREVIIAGSGDVLCYDMTTGRYFVSTMEDIKRAENKVNHELIHFMSCSLSFFYEEIGLPPTPYTDSVGWNMNNHMEVVFTTTMSSDSRPCIAIDFTKPPVLDYDKVWN